MDTPYSDRRKFSHVTGLLSVSSAEVSEPGSLTHNIIEQVSTCDSQFFKLLEHSRQHGYSYCFQVPTTHNTCSNCFKAEAEVKRLDQLKASKMKELFLKKQNELEDICNNSHMEIPSQSEMDKIIGLLNSGREEISLF